MPNGVKWIGLRRWKRDTASNKNRVKNELKQRGKTSGDLVAKAAKAQFTGRVSDSSRKRRSRGRKLGVYSGRLQRAISATVTVRRTGLRVEIGPTGKPGFYGAVHELGLGSYPERPFLEPGAKSVADEVFKELGLVVKVIR